MVVKLPTTNRGRRSATQERAYQLELATFAQSILEIQSTLDFQVSSRGWCYILEEHGLAKGGFDRAEALINHCRKTGLLPLDICAEDQARTFNCLEEVDEPEIEDEVTRIQRTLDRWISDYTPLSFWEDQSVYLQLLVEKIDLKSLFEPLCNQYHIPISNARGWSDLNQRASMMQRFQEHEQAGRQCVLLYCGDFDPAGLRISECLRNNLADLTGAVGWSPDHLEIDRFGLNYDFIQEQGLSWIDDLETGSGRDLADPRHPDHRKPYVQDYLQQYGARKVEANALVTRPRAGRQLYEQAILTWLENEDAPDEYQLKLQPYRKQLRTAFDASRGCAA